MPCFNHLMIDIETLGGLPDGFIAQIAAVWFDPMLPLDAGGTGANYSQKIRATGRISDGVIDYDTVAWWLRQSKEAQAAVFGPEDEAVEPGYAALSFINFFDDHCPQEDKKISVWTAGNYDLPLLKRLAARTRPGINWPLRYATERDFRTLRKEIGDRLGILPPERSGAHHEALADALWQADYCGQILRAAEAVPMDRARAVAAQAVYLRALAEKARTGEADWARRVLAAADRAAEDVRRENLIHAKTS